MDYALSGSCLGSTHDQTTTLPSAASSRTYCSHVFELACIAATAAGHGIPARASTLSRPCSLAIDSARRGASAPKRTTYVSAQRMATTQQADGRGPSACVTRRQPSSQAECMHLRGYNRLVCAGCKRCWCVRPHLATTTSSVQACPSLAAVSNARAREPATRFGECTASMGWKCPPATCKPTCGREGGVGQGG